MTTSNSCTWQWERKGWLCVYGELYFLITNLSWESLAVAHLIVSTVKLRFKWCLHYADFLCSLTQRLPLPLWAHSDNLLTLLSIPFESELLLCSVWSMLLPSWSFKSMFFLIDVYSWYIVWVLHRQFLSGTLCTLSVLTPPIPLWSFTSFSSLLLSSLPQISLLLSHHTLMMHQTLIWALSKFQDGIMAVIMTLRLAPFWNTNKQKNE